MSKHRSSQATRGANLEGEVRNLALDTTVSWLRMLHQLAGEALPGGASGGPSDKKKIGNLAVDLAEKGVEVWRGLLDVQRRYDGELFNLAGGGTFRAAAAGEELAVVSGTLRPEGTSKGTVKPTSVTLHNRSRTWLEIVFPKAILVEKADGSDKLLLDVVATPAAPVLGPGDLLEVVIMLRVGDSPKPDSLEAGRYHGTLCIDSRGPFRLELPLELTVTP